MTKVAEATIADAQKKVLSPSTTPSRTPPAGTENAVALVKSAVAAANNAYEACTRPPKQAAEVAEPTSPP